MLGEVLAHKHYFPQYWRSLSSSTAIPQQYGQTPLVKTMKNEPPLIYFPGFPYYDVALLELERCLELAWKFVQFKLDEWSDWNDLQGCRADNYCYRALPSVVRRAAHGCCMQTDSKTWTTRHGAAWWVQQSRKSGPALMPDSTSFTVVVDNVWEAVDAFLTSIKSRRLFTRVSYEEFCSQSTHHDHRQ